MNMTMEHIGNRGARSILAVVAICTLSITAFGQGAAPTPTPNVQLAGNPPVATAAASPSRPTANYVLHEGDDVPLRFAQDLSSKTAAEGDPVSFEIASDLAINGAVVAKAGSNAFGEVTIAKKSGMMGKPGELNIRLDYLKVGTTKVHLRGSKSKEGNESTGSAVALTILFGPIGLIKHGHNIDIKQGTPLSACAAEDVFLIPVSPPATAQPR